MPIIPQQKVRIKMNKIKVDITIEVVTGLHIGIGGDKAQIGGIDSPVIKDPVSKVPYIPGSSLKGKLRCLLETEAKKEYPGGVDNPKINKYFGATSEYSKKEEKNRKNDSGQKESEVPEESLSKFLFRDLKMSKTQRDQFLIGTLPLESKTEISIDRYKGTASKAGPRTIERVPPGTIFESVVLFRYKDDSELDEMKEMLNLAVKLLMNDALGGSGSRGYGAVLITLEYDKSPDNPDNLNA